MKLDKILKDVGVIKIDGNKNVSVDGISYDSKDVGKDYLFVAVKGFKSRGLDFAKEAVKGGASVIVYDEKDYEVPAKVTGVCVADSRMALSKISANYYSHPTLDMTAVGITGTNGKTTITYLLEAILKASDVDCAVTGTVSHRVSGSSISAKRTTPESKDLQKFYKEAKGNGVKYAVMEASSHAIALKRLEDIHFDICVFSNLTQDHLDFHKNLEEYKNTKKELFERVLKNSCKKKKFAVLNIDDPLSEKIKIYDGIEKVTFGRNTIADVRPVESIIDQTGIKANIKIYDETLEVESSLVGEFNLNNILASVAVAGCLGLSNENISKGVADLKTVPGRMESVSNKDGVNIYIDYAHTDDALLNVLETVNKIKNGRLITVFGCGGNRDKGKRPLMGKVTTDSSDITIITSDNPRSEDPEEIIGDITKGIDVDKIKRVNGSADFEKGTKYYLVNSDRKSAIRRAIDIAEKGDSILIAGKGHEDYQELKKGRIFFSDKECVEKILRDDSKN